MSKVENLSELVHDLRAEQRRLWIQGEPQLAEAYFEKEPRIGGHKESALDFVYGEYCLREELGETVDAAEYLGRFPQFESELKLLFEVHRAIESDGLQNSVTNPSPAGSTRKHWNCPVCHNRVDSADVVDNQDLVCPTCGNSFRIESERLHSWAPDALPTIGKFKLVEIVGRGAFGTVYRGRDTELQRTVAVKVPRSGQLATSEDEDRFVREARNAAQLQHAGIVPVFEVGRAAGFPYLVSEFVEGVTLGDVMTSRRLGFREAAVLLSKVSQAVEHAHSRGVIHRDLKPSNIMITPSGVPRVMDFGLAKRDAGEATMTTDGAVLGTPAYMSPEQAAGLAHHVDARSDVYSLGVILYQLITGELPFRGNQRMMLHQVQHDEPRNPRSLNDRIPKDLSTICLKSMAKEPSRRYATAQALADDLGRYLTGQPILARPVGRIDRAWRWCRRNSMVASLAASISFLLVFSAFGLGTGLIFVNRLRLEANGSAKEAEAYAKTAQDNYEEAQTNLATAIANASKAAQVSDFLVNLFETADPVGWGQLGFRQGGEVGTDLTLRDVLDRGSSQARRALQDQPLSRASLLDTLGRVYSNLGLLEQAEPLVDEAYKIRSKHPENESDLADSLLSMGTLTRWQGGYAEAERLLRKALEIRTRLTGPDSLAVAEVEFALAWTLIETDRIKGPRWQHAPEYEQLLNHTLKVQRRVFGSSHRDITLTRILLCLYYFDAGRRDEAEELLYSIIPTLPVKDAVSIGGALLNFQQGAMARRDHNYSKAERHYRLSVESARKGLGKSHVMTLIISADMGGLLRDMGRMDEFDKNGTETLAIARQAFPKGHPMLVEGLDEWLKFIETQGRFEEVVDLTQWQIELEGRFFGQSPVREAGRKLTIAQYRLDQGRLDETNRLLDEVQSTIDEFPDHDQIPGLMQSHRWIEGTVAGVQGDLVTNERIYRDCVRIEAETARPGWGLKNSLAELIHSQRPNDPETMNLLLTPDISNPGALAPAYPSGADQHLAYARVLIDRGNLDEALPILKFVSDFLHKKSMPGNYRIGRADSLMGACLAAKGHPDEGEPLLIAGFENLRKSRGDHHRLTREALQRLVSFYKQIGRSEESERYAKLLTAGQSATAKE